MGLDEQIAAVYGVKVATAPLVPLRSARPESMVLAAEQVALAIGEHRPRRRRIAEPPWLPLPISTVRADVTPAITLARLQAWAAGGGAQFDGIEIVVTGDGNRSIRARRDFAEGESIMIVPRRLMIVDADVDESSLAGSIATVAGELRSGHTVLSAWLATERDRPDSPWRPYLDVLPATFPHMPMFLGRADLDQLGATCAGLAAIDARDSVAEDHAVIARLAPLADLGLAEFAWARAILGSRAFKVDIGGHDRRALVPVADLFDHSQADATWAYDDVAQAFVVSALRSIAATEEIGFSYGGYDNGRYLVGYGFAVADNPEEEASLRFPPATDAHTDLAGHLLWDLPLGADAVLPMTTNFDARARRAISVARLRASTPRERVAAADRGRFLKRELRWLGSRIEQAALQELATAARLGIKALTRRPSVREGATPTAWQRTAAIVRHSEQALLEQILAFTTAAAPLVAVPDDWAWRRTAEAIPELTGGAERLLRGYLLATADELPR